MNITSIRIIDNHGVIIIQPIHDEQIRVRLGMFSSDRNAMSYESACLGYEDYIMAPKFMPLHECWHHAMIFLGVVEPDNISHPSTQ